MVDNEQAHKGEKHGIARASLRGSGNVQTSERGIDIKLRQSPSEESCRDA